MDFLLGHGDQSPGNPFTGKKYCDLPDELSRFHKEVWIDNPAAFMFPSGHYRNLVDKLKEIIEYSKERHPEVRQFCWRLSRTDRDSVEANFRERLPLEEHPSLLGENWRCLLDVFQNDTRSRVLLRRLCGLRRCYLARVSY